MRQYECVYILDPALAEDDLGALSERFRQVVVGQGGNVDGMDKWEKRRLAYEVKGKREGVYYVMNFTANPGAEAELERVLRLTEGVLRHMVVKLDDDAIKHMQAQAAQAAQRAQAQAHAPAPAPAAAPAAEAPAPAAPAEAQTPPAPEEATEPTTTEPAMDEASEEVVAASEATQTDKS